jgi:hypothetical protein
VRQAAEEEKYEEAAVLRDQVALLRKELAGNAVAVVGEKQEAKDYRPIFGKRIFQEAMRKAEEERLQKEKLLLTSQ